MPNEKRTDRVRHEPTPEEIRKICAEIREGWTEHQIARQVETIPWELLHVKTPPLFE